MSWYEKLLDTAKDVAPTVAGGAATAFSEGSVGLGAVLELSELQDAMRSSGASRNRQYGEMLSRFDKMLESMK